MIKTRLFIVFLACTTFAVLLPATQAAGNPAVKETVDIVHKQLTDRMQEVKSKYNYKGVILVENEEDDEEIRTLPLTVRADFYCDQRVTMKTENSAQAIRMYKSATASIKAGTGKTDSKLELDNQMILSRIQTTPRDLTLFEHASVQEMLSQREYELLKNPGDPLTFHRLFQKTKVNVGDKWATDDEALSGFLALDRVITNNVQLSLKSLADGKAKIHITGRVKGESDDVIVEMTIKGTATYDVKEQQVTWLRLDMDKKRRLGQMAPGFEGQVKVDVAVNTIEDNEAITRDAIKKKFKGKKLRFTFKLDSPGSAFVVTHEPGWRVIASEKEAAVLRFIRDGQLLAQCNAVQLPSRPKDKPLTLDQFKKEIEKVVVEGRGRVVDTSKFKNANGLSVMRLLVDGKQSDLDVRWLYYHLTSPDGRRMTVVFTIEQDLEDEFAAADRLLVNDVRFKTKPITAAQRSSRNQNR